MNKILIRAYTAANLGDDLFIKILCERYPDKQFYIISQMAHSKALKSIANLKVFYCYSFLDRVLLKLGINITSYNLLTNLLVKYTDLVVNIGGSIFMENRNWEKMAKNYEEIVNNSDSFFVLGSNFGPYEKQQYFETYSNIFKKIDDICFRDEYSYNLFKDLPNTRYAPDIVFSLNVEKVNTIELDETVVISVINLQNRDNLKSFQTSYEAAILNLSKEIIFQGKKVILISFCRREGDEIAIKRIMKKFEHRNLTSYFYNGNMDEALSIIKSSTGIVATRFHSMILGLIFNIPVFTFAYSDKTLNVIKDLNTEDYYLDIKDIDQINIDKAINQLNRVNSYDNLDLSRKSDKHFEKLDKVL